MDSGREVRRAEVEANHKVFVVDLPGLMKTHPGQFVVYRHGRIVGFGRSFAIAEIYFTSQFSDGIFSIQEIVDQPLNLRTFRYG